MAKFDFVVKQISCERGLDIFLSIHELSLVALSASTSLCPIRSICSTGLIGPASHRGRKTVSQSLITLPATRLHQQLPPQHSPYLSDRVSGAIYKQEEGRRD